MPRAFDSDFYLATLVFFWIAVFACMDFSASLKELLVGQSYSICTLFIVALLASVTSKQGVRSHSEDPMFGTSGSYLFDGCNIVIWKGVCWMNPFNLLQELSVR